MELLRKKSRTHFDIKCSEIFFDPPLKNQDRENKNKQMGPNRH